MSYLQAGRIVHKAFRKDIRNASKREPKNKTERMFQKAVKTGATIRKHYNRAEKVYKAGSKVYAVAKGVHAALK